MFKSIKASGVVKMQAKYKNKSRNGLKNGHEYIIQISKPTGHYYVYDCHVIFDVTKQEEMNLWMNYASEISIKNNWEFDKLELDNE